MAYFDQNVPEEYNLEITKLNPTDRVQDTTFNQIFQSLVSNDAFLNENLKNLDTKTNEDIENINEELSEMSSSLSTVNETLESHSYSILDLNNKITASGGSNTAAGTELGLVKSGGSVTIADGIITVNDDSHDHTSITGKAASATNADTATKLATARTFRTNLASTSTDSFDGSTNVTPGVTGILPLSNGGTGATTATEALTNIGAAAKTHNHSGESINPSAIELKGASSHGGYIDFHYGASTDDYTTRVIEKGHGMLLMSVPNAGDYELLTLYNKPTGSYTGNGSSSARTIDTGGVGNAAIIRAGDIFALVTISGAVGKKGTSSPFTLNYNYAQFIDGILYLNTTDSAFNTSGTTYEYQVI